MATETTPLIASRKRKFSITGNLIDCVECVKSFSLSDFLRFIGPGFMIGIGYLDPGNWATDLAGSQFGYSLLYVILIANVMATVLQYLCIKLGIVTGNDLAMACRKHFSPRVNLALFIMAELAIIATDLAEVVGTAIALNMLFGLPLPWGVAMTSLDVLVVLTMYGAKHLKKYEQGIMILVLIVAACFVYLLAVSGPDWGLVLEGYIPTDDVFRIPGQLYISMAIIGATIMPHNLYLHSSIVRYRAHSENLGEITELPDHAEDLNVENVQPAHRHSSIPTSLWYSNADSLVALTGALLINSAILIVAAASFNKAGDGEVAELQDAYYLLIKHLGPAAGFAFALALFCAGQSSTITSTMAGQVVTEGFLGPKVLKFRPATQRLITRLIAIMPAMVAALSSGASGMNDLIVMSQVVLSIQLPFAIWPLVWITNGANSGNTMKVVFEREDVNNADNTEDSEGQIRVVDFVNSWVLKISSIVIATCITVFSLILLWQMVV